MYFTNPKQNTLTNKKYIINDKEHNDRTPTFVQEPRNDKS